MKTKRNELKEEIKKLEQSVEDYGNKVRKKIAKLCSSKTLRFSEDEISV